MLRKLSAQKGAPLERTARHGAAQAQAQAQAQARGRHGAAQAQARGRHGAGAARRGGGALLCSQLGCYATVTRRSRR